MLAGWTNPALAGSGVGCGLAGRTRPVSTQSGAASWPSPHMSKSHSFFGPPPFRVSLRYARVRVGSTDFAECDRWRVRATLAVNPSLVNSEATSAQLVTRWPAKQHSCCACSEIFDDGVAV